MTTQIQITYKPDQNGAAETEILSFGSKTTAEKFLQSVLKNPDVQSAKKV